MSGKYRRIPPAADQMAKQYRRSNDLVQFRPIGGSDSTLPSQPQNEKDPDISHASTNEDVWIGRLRAYQLNAGKSTPQLGLDLEASTRSFM